MFEAPPDIAMKDLTPSNFSNRLKFVMTSLRKNISSEIVLICQR